MADSVSCSSSKRPEPVPVKSKTNMRNFVNLFLSLTLFSGLMDSTVLIFDRNFPHGVSHSPTLNENAGVYMKKEGHDTFFSGILCLRGGRRVSVTKYTSDGEHAVKSGPLDNIIDKPCLKLSQTERTRPRIDVRNQKFSQASSDDDENSVGMIQQELTPSMRHHVDTLAPRDAASYAAEAARCLGELDVDAALACYAEAVRLEPRSGVFLDAYGSLLADCGRFACRRS